MSDVAKGYYYGLVLVGLWQLVNFIITMVSDWSTFVSKDIALKIIANWNSIHYFVFVKLT